MVERLNFTKTSIRGLPRAPVGKRLTYRDTKIPGLELRVTSAGLKTFSVFRRVKGGGPERITVGIFREHGGTTVEQARKRAGQINSAIDGGANPAAAKRAHKSELIFAELFREYLERHAKPRKRTWLEDLGKYKLYLEKSLGPKKLSAIARSGI